METSLAAPVLLVEDQETIRRQVSLMLDSSRFTIVDQAADGLSAVEKALTIEPSLIIMDISLPLLNGIEATRQIKTALPGVKIMIYTLHNTADYIHAALLAGADGFCTKGINARQLNLAAESILNGAAWIGPGIAEQFLSNCRSPDVQSMRTEAPNIQLFLSRVENRVLSMLMQGSSNEQIATELNLTLDDTLSKMRRIMRMLEAASGQ
jgi:two-component system, NarL family, response regulator LiaR